MSKKMVMSEIDLASPPALTEQLQQEVARLQKVGEADIDSSDIAPLSDEFWVKAVRNPYYKPTKTSTTLRIDSDVLAWLRSQGRGYQSRINAILRQEMLAALRYKSRSSGDL